MNYGHPLKFGTFITPVNTTPDQVVALAKLSESLGYDLVTFQDHPYQASFLDTWTLMSYVAAQTERIHIAPNVLNLPLRPPAVLARAAASLDLLSSGRFDLGIGSGAFWDGIKAMGGRSLSPGEALEALSEAIDILRSVWDADNKAHLKLEGKYYQVNGMKRGPLPAHNIPIWVGAYKPRMLRLTGRKGDGWLPSLPYLKPGDLRTGNQTIDDAAREAGRDPREIVRLLNIGGKFTASRGGLLNGPSEQWVEELLPLIVDEGISTFIIMGDDPRTMEKFMGEVAPALREAAGKALPQLSADSAIRPMSVKAKRRDGIDYDSVPAALANTVIEPGDNRYPRLKSTYARGGAPGIIFEVTSAAEVAEALAFARSHTHLPLSVRSGGHGISGRSTNDGGIVINLGKMNAIEILDQTTRRIRVGAGARWMDVAAALEPYGWALSSGDYGGVGVGGLATAGGVGWLVREHGLTIDHLRAVEMVLADGSVVRADADENPDLFWAVRGAGANFGIVTSFEFEVDEVGDIGWAQLVFDGTDAADFLEKWGAAVEAAPRDLTSFLIMGPPRRGQPALAHVMALVDSDDAETIVNRLQPIAEIAPLLDQNAVITSYANVMANAHGGDYSSEGEPVSRSALVKHITPEFAQAAARLIRSGAVYFFQIRSVGGAVADVDPNATAYGYRDANFSVTAFGVDRRRLDALWDEMQPHFEGLYLSFETDLRAERLNDAFPPETLERLRVLKLRYDPHNVFRDNFNIAPQPVTA